MIINIFKDYLIFLLMSGLSKYKYNKSRKMSNKKDMQTQTDCLHVPEYRVLPPNIRRYEVGTVAFEIGIHDRGDAAALDVNIDRCIICYGVPRRAVACNAQHICPHMMCDVCATEYFKIAILPTNEMKAPCPKCRAVIYLSDILVEERFPAWMKQKLNEIEVVCEDCGEFKGNRKDVDNHQVYHCHLRMIWCPNVGCRIVQPAYMMKCWHFQHCEHFRIYCNGCKLPVLATEQATHDCVNELNKTVLALQEEMASRRTVIPSWLKFGSPGSAYFREKAFINAPRPAAFFRQFRDSQVRHFERSQLPPIRPVPNFFINMLSGSESAVPSSNESLLPEVDTE
jgi:hypothetical protein